MGEAKQITSMSFQELWRIAIGKSPIKDSNFVGNELNKKIPILEKCFKYYKAYSEQSKSKLKSDKNVTLVQQAFSRKLAEFLNLDCVQSHNLTLQYCKSEFHGSKEKFEELIKDERNHFPVLGKVTEYYFSERLFLMRILKHMLSYFEDKNHQFQQEYAETVNCMKASIGKEVLSQYEKEFSSEPPSLKTRGANFTQQVIVPFAMQAIKEQCEMLEILFIYYSHFEMTPEILLKLAKIFKEQGYGAGHPLLEVVDNSVLAPILTRLNALQQMILIEGLDMEYLQRLAEADGVDQHKLSLKKNEFEQLDKIFCALSDVPAMAPVLLAWTTMRYQVLAEAGADLTQKLGERVIEQKVWHQIINITELHPIDSESPISCSIHNVLRRLLSCVAHSFHEDTLGEYGELIEAVTKVLDLSQTSSENFWSEKKSGTGLHLLLSSAAGYFPLHISPLMKLLTALNTGQKSSYEVFDFLRNLLSVAEYLAARGTDDVESIENGSYWKLLTNKNLIVAGGYHHFKISTGTVGNLVETQLGAMVQWQTPIDGWKFLHAEIESVLQYRGQSSDLEVLGYIDKATLVYGLVERMLRSLENYEDEENREIILECLEPFIDRVYPLMQRLVSMVNPPLDLFSLCVYCLTGWVKCDVKPANTAYASTPVSKNCANIMAVITGMSRVQLLPFSERNFMESLESAAKLPLHYVSELPAPLYPGIFGSVLASVERPIGRYPITVAFLDLILVLVERTILWSVDRFQDNSDGGVNLKLVVGSIAPSVLYFLKEIFPTFDKWRIDPETSDKIGLKCLNLCHLVLRSYHPKTHSDITLWSPVQHTILTILTHSHSIDIILKLIAIPVDSLHSLLAAEPTSLAARHVSEAIRHGFSVLNNILRLEHDVANTVQTTEHGSTDEQTRVSYLHSVLASPNTGGPNLVALVAGYLYNKHDSSLPRMALSLLKRISIAAPMSLHASLGKDVSSIRDVLLSRLRSKSEDIHLKIGILEFLTISVQTQPGLLELFLDLEQIDEENPEKGLKLGKMSCLRAVLELINKDMQGRLLLPAQLHTACVKLLSSLWVDRRHSALKALRSYSATVGGQTSFWNSLVLPLFSENPPREVAQSDLLETAAHIFNTIGLECFYTTPAGEDPVLNEIMGEFSAKDRYNHWSKVLVCVCKTLPRLNRIESESRLMFIAAWKMFVLTSKLNDPVRIKKYINDIMMALEALVENLDVHSGIATALSLTSSLLLTLLYKAPANTLTDFEATEKMFSKIIRHMEVLKESAEKVERSQISFHAIVLHLFSKLKELSERKIEFSESFSIWLRLSCSELRDLHRNELSCQKGDFKRKLETSILLIQAIQDIYFLFGLNEDNLSSWMKILIEESTFNLLASVILRLICSTHEDNDGNGLRASLATAILRLLSTVCRDEKPALAFLKTGIMSEFSLKLSNTYAGAVTSQKKRWLKVYQLSLVLMQNMLDALKHNFLDHALDFIGVHDERIVQCLESVCAYQTPVVLQEAVFATSLLSSLAKSFLREWRFKLLHSYQVCMDNVAALCYSCVAMLLRPRLLQEAIEMSTKQADSGKLTPVFSGGKNLRQTSVRSRKSLSQDEIDVPSPKFLSTQQGLFAILGNCLAIFKHLSPDLCQILLDQTVDPEEFQPILSIGFSMPSLDQITPPTFGTVLNASNVAWKIISQGSTNSPELLDIANYVMDMALTVAIAQGMLLLKHPMVSSRDKQKLRRELGDELVSCLRLANRHSRLSGGGVTSPQSSPSGARTPLKSMPSLTKQFSSSYQRHHSASVSIDRGMLDLVDLFVKGVLR